jgi:hypothetical protein
MTPAHAIACAENIALLNCLHFVPTPPSPNPVDSFYDGKVDNLSCCYLKYNDLYSNSAFVVAFCMVDSKLDSPVRGP